MPEGWSRDFAAALMARERGYCAVSVTAAICYVPRGTSLRREDVRKGRTMARGLRTLWHKRILLSPSRHGRFAWVLLRHKLCPLLTPRTVLLAAAPGAALTP